MGANATLCDRDFFAWSREQAALLRAGRASEADLANIAEEIESMGRGEKRELISRFAVVLLQLAKWRYRPNLRSRSWRSSIGVQRAEIADLLADNPSLRPLLPEFLTQAWRRARLGAASETGLAVSTFPLDCPWAPEQLFDDTFWPE